MITSLNEQVGRAHRRHTVTPLQNAYQQLNQFIDHINLKITDRLQLVQQVYAEDYRQQTAVMKQELDRLRANLDAEIVLQRSSEKMLLLQEQRDFFRAQVLKLNQEVNLYAEQNKQLRKTISDIEVETANLKTICLNQEKKVSKLQKELTQMANFKREASASVLPTFQQTQTKAEEKEEQEGTTQLHPLHQTSTSQIKFFQRRPTMTVRTKSLSRHQSATKASMHRYQQSNRREQIIDDCIREIKKQIFYRSHEQKGQGTAFQDFGKVPFEKFFRTDKKQLIQSLLANEKILEEFNEFLVGRNSQTAASKMLRTKVGDEKFNEKFLSDLKRSFGKKIYDLKTNPDTGALSRAIMKKKLDYE